MSTAAHLRETAALLEALAEVPRVRRRLKQKPNEFHDAIVLEISAADFAHGETQGSDAYFHVPLVLGPSILDAAEQAILAELKRRKVKIPK
jgi:hypothetical protein